MNNADLGLTIQYRICNFYGLVPCTAAMKQFSDSYNPSYISEIDPIIVNIFKTLGANPIRCTTFERNPINNSELIPYNFILDNGQTLSVRTTKGTKMVAPRVVGQAGFAKFNEKFHRIIRRNVSNQEQIRTAVFENIDKMLPVFIDYTFSSDYLVWVYTDAGTLKYLIIDTDKVLDLTFDRKDFTFTRDPSVWTESTTIKYKGITLAEAQTHKNRSFKFRFNFPNLIQLILKEQENNETIGITAEKIICDLFNLPQPASFKSRYSKSIYNEMLPTVKKAFTKLPKAIKHTGSDSGIRKGNSKCPYDFLLVDKKTLSVKTNIGKMVCPPEVGQPNDKTFYSYFKKLIKEDHVDEKIFKQLALKKSHKMMPIYVNHLFDSDFLLRIYRKNNKWEYEIVVKLFGQNMIWEKSEFSFTKESIKEWNESNTVKYRSKRLGEYQYHHNRNCYKFRFDFDNLVKLINEIAEKTNKKS